MVIDTAKKSLLVGGAEVTLSAKEWLLLELVYKHRNELVTCDSIRMTVWAERVSSAGRPPEVEVENKPSPVQTAPQTGRRCEISSKPAAAGAASGNRLNANIVFGVFLFCNETVIRPLYFFRPAIAKIKARKNYTEECS